jgi:hypothetical protein
MGSFVSWIYWVLWTLSVVWQSNKGYVDLFPTSGEGSGGDAYSVGLLVRANGLNRGGVSPSDSPDDENKL